MLRKKIAKLLADMANLQDEAEQQGNAQAAKNIEAAIASIKEVTNFNKGVDYAIHQLPDGYWVCEYLDGGERNKKAYGTCGTGYKVFDDKHKAIESGERYIKKWLNTQ